jgi:hypothetical protein
MRQLEKKGLVSWKRGASLERLELYMKNCTTKHNSARRIA